MDRTKDTPLPDRRTAREHSNPWHSERIIALSLTPGSPAKYLNVVMASGVAIVLIGLFSGTAYWILGALLFLIGVIAHCMEPETTKGGPRDR